MCIPVVLWDLLPNNAAYSFIEFVTFRNLVLEAEREELAITDLILASEREELAVIEEMLFKQKIRTERQEQVIKVLRIAGAAVQQLCTAEKETLNSQIAALRGEVAALEGLLLAHRYLDHKSHP